MLRFFDKFLLLCLCLILAQASFAAETVPVKAETKAQKTLFRNGFHAAGFGNILLDYGDVDGSSLTRLTLQAGFQLARWEEWLSISLGYTKTGFYTGLLRHAQSYEGENLRYDLSGPSLHLSLFPQAVWTADINYVYATARLKRNLSTGAEADPARPDSIDEATWKSYEQRSKLDGADLSLLLIWRVSQEASLVLGAGQRSLSGDVQIYTNENIVYESIAAKSRSLSESYFLFGVRGSQF